MNSVPSESKIKTDCKNQCTTNIILKQTAYDILVLTNSQNNINGLADANTITYSKPVKVL